MIPSDHTAVSEDRVCVEAAYAIDRRVLLEYANFLTHQAEKSVAAPEASGSTVNVGMSAVLARYLANAIRRIVNEGE